MSSTVARLFRIVTPVIVLGVSGLCAYILILNKPAVQTELPTFVPPVIRVHTVTLQDVELLVRSQGTVKPRTESQLVPEISGRVISVASSFASGGFFEEGDVLLKIDPYDYEQAIISDRARLAEAKLHLAREEAEAELAHEEWEELGRGAPRALTLHEPQLEDAKAAVAAALANLDRAKRNLDRAELRAPYAGRVLQKNVDIGQFISLGTPVATIYAVDYAEIRLPLPDEELAYLDLPLSYRGGQEQSGPPVTLLAQFAGRTHQWQGLIVRTEGEIDAVSRMVHVVAQVKDPYALGTDPNRPPLAAGMYVEATIIGRIVRGVAVLPRAALSGSSQVLIVDEESRLRFKNIELLRTTVDTIVVRAGLETGDMVSVSPLEAVTDGMKVQVLSRTANFEEEP